MSENFYKIASRNQIESDKHNTRSEQVKSKPNINFIGKLVSKDNILLIRNKKIEIGRRCSTSEVDFQIGKNKFVSRKHLILTYDEEGFLLTCIGKNGIFVDGKFRRYRTDMPQFNLPKSCVLRFPNTNIRLQFESLESQNLNISIQQNDLKESMDSIANNSETFTINRRKSIQYVRLTKSA